MELERGRLPPTWGIFWGRGVKTPVDFPRKCQIIADARIRVNFPLGKDFTEVKLTNPEQHPSLYCWRCCCCWHCRRCWCCARCSHCYSWANAATTSHHSFCNTSLVCLSSAQTSYLSVSLWHITWRHLIPFIIAGNPLSQKHIAFCLQFWYVLKLGRKDAGGFHADHGKISQ